ncbi:hypothetical protein V8C43DRAFT_277104 [Trichoderma afarasin]
MGEKRKKATLVVVIWLPGFIRSVLLGVVLHILFSKPRLLLGGQLKWLWGLFIPVCMYVMITAGQPVLGHT